MNATRAFICVSAVGPLLQREALRLAPAVRVRAMECLPVLGLCMALSGPAFAQPINENLWVTNGDVYAVNCIGGTIYIGGSFTQVGPATGGGVPLDPASGAPIPAFPKVVGTVSAVVADGAGGWYIGGFFSAVGGVPRSNIAHITSDQQVSPWNPVANSYGVCSMALGGSSLYVGGSFTSIGGQARNAIAELDLSTGAATTWNPNFLPPSERVNAIAVSGSTVFAGGDFGLIAIDASGAVNTAWNASASAGDLDPPRLAISALAVSGSTLYVGGWFSSIGGQARNRIAALDVTTGAATDWNPDSNPDDPRNGWVGALTVAGSTVYVGGNFYNIGGQPRNYIAALDASTGAATAWNPNVDIWSAPYGNVRSMVVSGGIVYAAGYFGFIGGQPRNNLAALDATTGLATNWNPNASAGVVALAMGGSRIYAGGELNSIGGVARTNLAALDAATGMATAWNPIANDKVWALAGSGSTIYAGGSFTRIGGLTRNRIAAIDANSGIVTGWNPSATGNVANADVLTLAVSGPTVYAGGYFKNIGGAARAYVAALDASTGLATGWDAGADRYVHAIAVSGSTVYVGGEFGWIGGAARRALAALDATTAAATSWNPSADNSILALAVNGSIVYAGGHFSTIGGLPRTYLAALDGSTGAATTWNPIADGPVRTFALSGSLLFVGGDFAHISGQVRSCVAAFDVTTGVVGAWSPAVWGGVTSLAVGGPVVYVGGYYPRIGTLPISHISAIGTGTLGAPGDAGHGPLVPLLENSPNPFRHSTDITFTLSSESPVTLEVFDLAGRLVATLIRDEPLASGPHRFKFAGAGLPSGLYLSRLRTAGDVHTGRMLLLE